MESKYTEIARACLEGKRITDLTLRGKTYKFSEKQSEFISDMDGRGHKFLLYSGGRGCGKSLALCVKIYLICKGFPGIRVVLGRKNISDIEKTTLQDLFKLMPANDYEHRVKDGLINFKNGSQIVLFGLDAMQSGNIADIKKAQQKTKSLNIGAYFIDQLEEIEYDVFQALGDTMRMTNADLDYPRQGNMTCNPANFWGYHYFKLNERMNEDGQWVPKAESDVKLIEGSMLDNRDNLPDDFVKDRMNREESYVKRFVHGEWTTDILLRGGVFAKEHVRALEVNKRLPIEMSEGCEIYETPRPGVKYQMGVDPSEGIVDPCSIAVVSDSGKLVATYSGMLPMPALIDKVKFLYHKYSKPLIVPEVNSAGVALLEGIKDLKIYRRRQFEYKERREVEKLGFKTSWASKQALISHFNTLLRDRVPKIYSLRFIEQAKTFVWSDEASQSGAGASRGFHDDEVMAVMLAYWEFSIKRVEELQFNQTKVNKIKKFQYL